MKPALINAAQASASTDLRSLRRLAKGGKQAISGSPLPFFQWPKCALGPNEIPPSAMLEFVAQQFENNSAAFADYARRDKTRREHANPAASRVTSCRARGQSYRIHCYIGGGCNGRWNADRRGNDPVIERSISTAPVNRYN